MSDPIREDMIVTTPQTDAPRPSNALKLKSSRAHRLGPTILSCAAAVLLGGQAAVAQDGGDACNNAEQPCFASIPDILGGRRNLLPADDLVVNLDLESDDESKSNIRSYFLDTKDLTINSVSDNDIVVAPCIVRSPVPAPAATRFGRIFDIQRGTAVPEVTVTLTPKSDASGTNCEDGDTELQVVDFLDRIDPFTTGLGFKPGFTRLAIDDFDLDGFDEVFLIGPFLDSSFNPILEIYEAVDVKDVSQGLTARNSLLPANQNNTMPRSEPVTGDFNGDGIIDVAWIGGADNGGDLEIFIASICPNDRVTVLGQACETLKPVMTPVSIKTELTWAKLSNDAFPDVALVAGNFDGQPDTELVFLERVITPPEKGVRLTAYKFESDFTAIAGPKPLIVGLDTDASSAHFYADSGTLDGASQQEQVVVAQSEPEPGLTTVWRIDVVRFGADLAMTADHLEEREDVKSVRVWGTAVGRFDPPDGSNGETNFNQQIAVLFTEEFDTLGPNTRVDIYTVDPAKDDYTPVGQSARVIGNEILLSDTHRPAAPLQAGDFQGRSLRLGAPEKIKISGHIQPNFVIGVPPMHVDYIPLTRGGEPEIVNVSVAAEIDEAGADDSEFNTTYTFSTSSSRDTSQQSTISTTTSTKKEADAKVSYGIPDIASVSVSVKTSAENTSMNSLGSTLSFKNKNTSSLTRSTGLSDLVWFQKKDFFIYIYPVIGQTVCPEGIPDCSESEKLPLHVHFSGPDEIQINLLPAQNILMGANNLEFYQPPHQPLNLLSYPWSLSTVEGSFPRADALTDKDPTFQAPGNSPGTFSSTWSQSSGSEQSVGASNNHSYDSSVSVSAGVDFDGIGADASASVDKSGSTAISTLTTTKSSVSSSEGVTVTIPALDEPGTWKATEFGYELGAFIFGQNEIPNTLDSSEPSTDVKTRGVQRIGFAAQATEDLWGQIYTKPDVALNHPNRWSWDNVTKIVQPTKNKPDDIQQSPFHAMRGFFVTAQAGDGVEAPTGPQVTVLNDGEEVTLWTRIHNFSQVPIDSDTTIHVRFFGQVFDSTIETCPTNVNCSFVGPSFEIGTATVTDGLAAYPLSNSNQTFDQTDPNWKLVNVPWDTSKGCGQGSSCAGKEVVFWVLTWAETNGKLLEEMAGHGLTEIPSQVDDITKVPLEFVEVEIEGDNESRSFTNNVGFYNQTFFVCSADDECASTGSALPASAEAGGDLIVDEVTTETDDAMLGDSIKVSAHIATTDQPFKPLSVFFYDGDPTDETSRVFDHEYVPFVGSNSSYIVGSRYLPLSCGPHEIHVVVAAAGGAPVTNLAMLDVTVDPFDEVATLIEMVRRLELQRGLEFSLTSKLSGVRSRFARGQTNVAINKLNVFSRQVQALSGKKIGVSSADSIQAQVDRLIGCL